jgi:hypothetical protein
MRRAERFPGGAPTFSQRLSFDFSLRQSCVIHVQNACNEVGNRRRPSQLSSFFPSIPRALACAFPATAFTPLLPSMRVDARSSSYATQAGTPLCAAATMTVGRAPSVAKRDAALFVCSEEAC